MSDAEASVTLVDVCHLHGVVCFHGVAFIPLRHPPQPAIQQAC